jgi:hypothetical protein
MTSPQLETWSPWRLGILSLIVSIGSASIVMFFTRLWLGRQSPAGATTPGETTGTPPSHFSEKLIVPVIADTDLEMHGDGGAHT